MIKQPYYILEFSAISCMFEIRINDNPVMTLNLKGQASTQIPVNYAISENGEQQISIRILPLLGEVTLHTDATLNYKMYLYDVSNGFEMKEVLFEYNSPKVDKNNPLPVIANQNIFAANVSYTLRDYWKLGGNLKDVDDLYEKLREEYLYISQMIQKRNYEWYKNKIADREYNMAVSMYLSQQESDARLKRLIRDFDNGYNKVEFPDDLVPVYSAYGKKVSLKRKDGDPALSFVNEEEMEQQMLDIEFYWSKKTKRLEII